MSIIDIRYKAGQLDGTVPFRLHGYTANLDAAAFQSLGMGDDDTYTIPSAAGAIAVASTSANDTSAGTGARTLSVTGLDADYAELTETFTLNGQTKVTGTSEFLRIYEIKVLTAGSGGVNAGDLWVGSTGATFTAGVPDTKHMFAQTGWNKSSGGQYCVPAGYKLVVDRMLFTSRTATSKVVELRLEARDNGTGGSGLWEVLATHAIQDAAAGIDEHFVFTEKTDVRFRAKASANDAEISASLNCMLIGS